MSKIDLYSPYEMPDGRKIYGAAAANRRIADAGGFNEFSLNMFLAGIRIGYQQALSSIIKQQHK